MKIAWTSDGHVGNYGKQGGPTIAGVNQRCADTLMSLAWSVGTARSERCEAFVHAGDLFDYERMEPQVVARVQHIFRGARNMDGISQVLLLPGNHDQKSTAAGDHAMAPLAPVATVVEEPRWFVFDDVPREPTTLLMVPFQAGRGEDWLPTTVKAASEIAEAPPVYRAPRILCIHLGISDTRTPYHLDGADDSVCLPTIEKICKAHGFTHVFAGNWHYHRRWTVEGDGVDEVEVVQIGTLCPNRFTDTGGRFGTMAILDTATGKVTIRDVPGPRFVKCAGLDALRATLDGTENADVVAMADPLYLSTMVLPQDQAAAEKLLAKAKAGPWASKLRHYEVHLDRSAEDDQTRTAIAAAVSATSHEEAVRAYVAAAPLEETVSRKQVQAFVGKCLLEAKSVE